MKLRTCLLSTVAAIGLGAVALPAAADDFFFDATAVGAFGAPTYGKVSLSQVGTGVALGDIGTITDAGPQTFSVSTPNAVNPPFGSFQFGIACATNCSNGNSQGGYNDPLTFTVANSTIADFFVPSTNAGDLGPAYFAADVVWRADTQSFGATGAIGVTHITTPVPEPETYALFLAGLGAMGFMAKRRRKAV